MRRHHDLCWGCGQANLFGLQMEADGEVSARFFVKQDHQGPSGTAHGGVLAAALYEAMALAGEAPDAFRVALLAPVPVGTFVDIEATPVQATARLDDAIVAEARA